MVHALETLHPLLTPDGELIDIHPSSRPPRVEIHHAGKIEAVGHLGDREKSDYDLADDALLTVIERGLFALENDEGFVFLYHCATPDILRDWIDHTWTNAVLPDEVAQTLRACFGDTGPGKEVVVRRWLRMRKLHVRF